MLFRKNLSNNLMRVLDVMRAAALGSVIMIFEQQNYSNIIIGQVFFGFVVFWVRCFLFFVWGLLTASRPDSYRELPECQLFCSTFCRLISEGHSCQPFKGPCAGRLVSHWQKFSLSGKRLEQLKRHPFAGKHTVRR